MCVCVCVCVCVRVCVRAHTHIHTHAVSEHDAVSEHEVIFVGVDVGLCRWWCARLRLRPRTGIGRREEL